ncbi:delta-lactam-biosynthetic de-N-acetylase [Clostridiales bacterium oral taxon 876 str. F0540]|nr:delta-lactam-biosynthetic de-N-acetylase [Clostridiales bacterium oral taxon 876 str. F0540]
MNKKILSAILVIPILFSGCSKIKYNNIETITSPIDDMIINKQPAFEENIIIPQDCEEEIKDNSKNGTSKTNGDNLNTAEKNWFYQPKKDGTPSGEPPEVLELIKKYSAYYLGDTSKKVLYLTFDEGYENGYTSKILDALKANDVKAAFFVTTPYINANKDLIKRMVDEGHLVCNHSNNHPSMAQVALKDKNKFEQEFTVTEKAFEEVTGTKMPKFFRPPMGKYNELSLSYTKELGYKTIFWSFAYKDWIPTEQPSIEKAKKVIMERTHNGGIILLHAVSKTNAEIMDSILKEWKNKGFEFKTLNDLP